ncbi:MAG: hypothetical protein ABI347_00035 [Nitrososphaera sp.]
MYHVCQAVLTARLTVHRKGHTRKAYTAKRGGKTVRVKKSQVKPSTFTTSDRGKKGKGPKIVPPLEEGALGGPGFFSRPQDEQERIVFERAKEKGEKKVVGELRALQVFFKRTDPQKSERALELSKKVAGSFKGKQQVDYPEGFSKHQSISEA